MEDSSNHLQTTNRSLSVLNAIFELNGARLADLIQKLDIPRSTLYLHLNTLIENQFIVRDGEYYDVGLRTLQYGEYARTQYPAQELISQKVNGLAETTSEEVDFSVEQGGRVFVVEDAVGAARKGFGLGHRLYMHDTAAGKAILSEYSRSRIEEIVDQWGLCQSTKNSITDQESLFRELTNVQNQGYAINDEENISGIYAIAATVNHRDNSVIGALVISGPKYRTDNKPRLIDQLLEAVTDLEEIIEERKIL